MINYDKCGLKEISEMERSFHCTVKRDMLLLSRTLPQLLKLVVFMSIFMSLCQHKSPLSCFAKAHTKQCLIRSDVDPAPVRPWWLRVLKTVSSQRERFPLPVTLHVNLIYLLRHGEDKLLCWRSFELCICIHEHTRTFTPHTFI